MAGFGPTQKNREIAEDPRLGRLSESATPAHLQQQKCQPRAQRSGIGLMRQSSP